MARGKKQLYAAVMILGGLALVVDRLILSAGATDPAEASASLGDVSPGAQSALDASAEETSSIPEVPFPRGVVPLDPGAEIRDLFAPPGVRSSDTLVPGSADNGRILAKSAYPPGRMPSATFKTQHRLQGILRNVRLKIAIVDDVWVRLGESLDGCTLIGIDGETAQFECFDGKVVLNMATQRGHQRD